MTRVPDALLAWAKMTGPARVIGAARTRAQRGQRTENGALATLDLSESERREIGLVLGTPWAVSGRPVRLQDLAARLAEHRVSVLDLIEALDGTRPVENRVLRADSAQAATAELESTRAVLTAAGLDEALVRAWLSDASLPKPGAGALLGLAGQVAVVWAAVPGPRAVPVRLAALAAATRRDAHALDATTALGRAVARLCAVVYGLPRPQRAGAVWRTAWSAAGVRCDEVSSRVLVLNLPLLGEGPAVRLCSAARDCAEPLWLTLRSLVGEWRVAPGTTVFVCENPTVVEAAADALGALCPPMVCTDGMPSGAAADLLAELAACGADLRVRADFDGAGLTIVEQIRSVAPTARAWRFDATAYLERAGAAVIPGGQAGSVDGDGDEWAALRRAFLETGVTVHEEQLLGSLLADLQRAADSTPSE